MGVHVIKLPDVGEGVAEAEFVELHVKLGDLVEPDQNLADVMTDKATVEIPSPRKGTVLWIGPDVGETVSVGAEIIKLEVEGAGNSTEATTPKETSDPKKDTKADASADAKPETAAQKAITKPAPAPTSPTASSAPVAPAARARGEGEKPLASPAVRARARARGIDLALVHGTGPAGRISHDDLDAYASGASAPRASGGGYVADPRVDEVKVIGLRRKIAEKMQESKRRIPHITYVEEVNMGALEDLRAHMNGTRKEDQPKLTVLPFLMRAIVLAARDYPHVNARFNDDEGVVEQYGAVHMGIATQTDNGLMVPVVRHAEANDIWTNASEVARISAAARDGSAPREALSGSTITITSLGPLGGIVTTPVINHPEVAIVGVNKMQTLPRYDANGNLVPTKLMNLSSGFDHRIVDGWDAAQFVQKIKAYLEFPATMFV